jgi:hypothetical protein
MLRTLSNEVEQTASVKKVRTCLSLLAPFVCAAALVPSVYIFVKTIESLPRLRLTQDGLPSISADQIYQRISTRRLCPKQNAKMATHEIHNATLRLSRADYSQNVGQC